jgi:hypothetical protein
MRAVVQRTPISYVLSREVRFDPSTPAAFAQDDLRFHRLNETAVVLVVYRAAARIELIFTLIESHRLSG